MAITEKNAVPNTCFGNIINLNQIDLSRDERQNDKFRALRHGPKSMCI